MVKFMRKFLLVLCVLCATSAAAKAEDVVLDQVNRSIVLVYTSATECIQTLIPGPDQYVKLIKEYFAKLYPMGTGYWILPEVKEYQSDRGVCIINLESSLQRYQRSLYDFHLMYPNRPQPPMLLAYQWRDNVGSASSKSAILQQLPLPAPVKGDTTEKRF